MFLYNKWYFDELYDFLFVRPALRLGRFLWKIGDGMIIDGLGPTASPRACWMRRAARCGCNPAMSITMPSRCCSAWWRSPPGSSFAGVRAMSGLPFLRLVTFLPLLGAVAILALSWRGAEASRATRAGSRWRTTLVDLRAVAGDLWAQFDGAIAGFQFVEKRQLAGRRHLLSHGRGRHFHAVRGADRAA